MGKRRTTSKISHNQIDGNGNVITINNYPAPAPPFNSVPEYVFHDPRTELRDALERIKVLQSHVERLTKEVKRLRDHISEKDDYINGLLFKRA